MPRFEITSPDGRKFEVNAPEGATPDQVLAYAQANFGPAPEEPAPNVMSAAQYQQQLAAREAPSRSISDYAVDTGITFLKGAIGLPESFVGLADIPTRGAVGKMLSEAGYKPKEAKEILDTYLSEAQQAANRKVSEAKGFLPTVGAALQNPSTIATSVGESLPQMIGGAGIARGALKAAPGLAPYIAGGIGEGAIGAGSSAEQMREQSPTGELTGKQAAAAIGSGVGTALIGAVAGKVADKLGFDNVNTMLASKSAKGEVGSVKDFIKQSAASGITEGVFEEMPQSAQEQMWMNYAQDKPLMEGVAEAAGMGLVSGAAMGAAGTAIGRKAYAPQAEAAPQAEVAPQVAQVPEEKKPEVNQQVTEPIQVGSQDFQVMQDELDGKFTPTSPSSTETANQTVIPEAEKAPEVKAEEPTPQVEPRVEEPTPKVESRVEEPAPKAEVAPQIETPKEEPKAEAPKVEAPKKEPKKTFASDLSPDFQASYERHLKAADAANKARSMVRAGTATQAQAQPFIDQAQKAHHDMFDALYREKDKLSNTHKEIVDLAERAVNVNQKGFAEGMLSNIIQDSKITPENMKFWKERTVELEAQAKPKEAAPIKEKYGLDNLFENQPMDKKRLQNFGNFDPRTKESVDKTNEYLQKLATAINEKGFNVFESNLASMPQDVKELKDLFTNLHAGASRLLLDTQHVVGKQARKSNKSYGAQTQEIQKAQEKLGKSHIKQNKDLEKARELLGDIKRKEPKAPVELRPELTGKPPEPPEIVRANEDVDYAEKEAKRTANLSRSLWTALRGKLTASNISNLGDGYSSLKAGKGKKPVDISTFVANGTLDDFLPYDMRTDSSRFDEKDSVEYIYNKLLEKNYITFAADMEIKQLMGSVEEAEALIQEHLKLKEINELIDQAADEQREAEINARVFEPEGEAGAAPTGTPELALQGETPEEVRSKEAAKEERAKEEKAAEKKDEIDKGVNEFALTGSNRPADVAAAQGQEDLFAKPKEEPKVHPEWATNHEKDVAGKIVYSNDGAALLKSHSSLTGANVYAGVSEKGQRTLIDINSYKGDLFTPKQLADLREARERVDAEDKANQAKFPEGPFQGKGNVVGTDTVDPKYVSYLEDLLKSIHLGDLKVFLLHPNDARDNAEKYHLYGDYASATSAGMSFTEDGSTRLFGPNSKYAYISFKPGMTEGRSIETIAHEVGHIIEKVALKNAPADVKAAIQEEHKKWLEKNKGLSAKDFIRDLRNRESSEAHAASVFDTKKASDLTNYWRSFDEWFADNVSRWATTAEKPVGIVEKFFSGLGKKLKELVNYLTGNKFLPNQSVANFIENMGPGLTEAWYKSKEPGTTKVSESKAVNFAGQPAPVSTFDLGEDSKLDKFLHDWVDKYKEIKDVLKLVSQTTKDIDDRFNAYQKEELYHKKVATKIKMFLNNELRPIILSMSKNKVSVAELEEFLHMRHAEERNEFVANRNPNMPDGGSGVETADARKYLANLDPDRAKVLNDLGDKIDEMVYNNQEELVKGGIETQSTIDALRKQFKHYVPLERSDVEFANSGTGLGAGYSTRGSSFRHAFGSTKGVINIFENLALQRERSIIRSEKAVVGRALYGMAIKFPNPKFWLPVNPDAIKDKAAFVKEIIGMGGTQADAYNLMQEPKVAGFDKNGQVVYRVNSSLRNSSNVFPVRINGRDRFIYFNPSDPKAMRMAESIKNLDTEQLDMVMGMIGNITRIMASLNTQYNPVFGLWNFARDTGGAAFNLTTTPIANKKAQVMKDTLPALGGIYQYLRDERKGLTSNPNYKPSKWAKIFNDYQEAGGGVGFKEQFSRGKGDISVIEKEMKKLNHGNVRKVASAFFNLLSDANDAMENAVRLATYQAALDANLSKDKAGSISKNITVNFNRKGAKTPYAAALYAFFNASVQGSSRLLETLKGPAGKKIMAGGIAVGVLQAIMLAAAGFDDDEPPEYLKDKNFVIPLPDGKYALIPMPLGINIFPGIGRIVTEAIFRSAGLISGSESPGKKMTDIAGLIMDTFNPLGSGSLTQSLSPTVFDPILAVSQNKDAFGRPIYREDRANNPTPGYTRSREGATAISKNIAEFMNFVSGGDKYKKGAISPTADEIDYLAGQYGGGATREAIKAGEALKAPFTGEELPSYRVPIIGKMYGETQSPSAVQDKFYKNITVMADHENEIKGMIKDRKNPAEYLKENPEARLWSAANGLENTVNALNKQRKALVDRGAPKEQIDRINAHKVELMKKFNDRVAALETQ